MPRKEQCISIITTKIKSDPRFNRYKKNLDLLLKSDFQWSGLELSLSATDILNNDERVKTANLELLNSLQEFISKINNLSYIGLVKRFDGILINIKSVAAEKKSSYKDMARFVEALQNHLQRQLDFYIELIDDKNINSVSPDGKTINYQEGTPEEYKKSYQQRMETNEQFTQSLSEQELFNLINTVAGQCPLPLAKLLSKDILWLDLHHPKLQQQLATNPEVQEARQKIFQTLYNLLIIFQEHNIEAPFVLKLLIQIVKETDELNATEVIAQLKVDEKYYPFYLKRVRLQQDTHIKIINWIIQVKNSGAVSPERKNEINEFFISENTKIYKEMAPVLEAEITSISSDESIIKLIDQNYSWLNNINETKISFFNMHPDFIESKVELMLILRHLLSTMKQEHAGILLHIQDSLKDYNTDKLWYLTDTQPKISPNVAAMFYDHLVGTLGAILPLMQPNVLVAVIDGEFIFTPDAPKETIDKFKLQTSNAHNYRYKFAKMINLFAAQDRRITTSSSSSSSASSSNFNPKLKHNQLKNLLLEQNDFIKNIQDENLSWAPMTSDDITKLQDNEEFKATRAHLLSALDSFLDELDHHYLTILHYLVPLLDRILKEVKVPPEHLGQFVIIFQKLQINLLKAYTHLMKNKCTLSISEDGEIVYKDNVPHDIKIHYKEHFDEIFQTFINETQKIKNEQTAVKFNSLLVSTYRQQNVPEAIPKAKGKTQKRF